ncbi:DUF2812 domain-containing protein [Shimazuella kribbensis]|uniref:DUF2812 domain-containing protein n=1 Tax=Shimazuella kribbensis TaxID=139808 RepID=UPI0004181E02|nr:DUF2812 domain-containing protein [Shimazuella kribbensis]
MNTVKYIYNGGLAFSEEKDMQRLSKYAKEGWILESSAFMGFVYKLRKGNPTDLVYNLDYRMDADDEYFSYFQEAGWKLVCSFGNQIYIFAAPVGTKPIYSDSSSLVEKYEQEKSKMGTYALPFLIATLVFFLAPMLGFGTLLPLWLDKTLFIFGMISLIPLIFTGLPFIGYVLRLKRINKK